MMTPHGSAMELVPEEYEEDVLFLALEEDDEHPYVHFPHCKVYLVLTLGWIVIFTLSIPIGIGYARPALVSHDFLPSQCSVFKVFVPGQEKKCRKVDENHGKEKYECLLHEEARCDFASIPICYKRSCRCLQVRVNISLNGNIYSKGMLYDYQDTYLNFPRCSIDPCSDDRAFDDLFAQIIADNKKLRCFSNGQVAIYYPFNGPANLTIFGALVVPALLFLTWLALTLYVLKRTWRVTRRDFKLAVEFRFNSWPPRPSHSLRASIPHGDSTLYRGRSYR